MANRAEKQIKILQNSNFYQTHQFLCSVNGVANDFHIEDCMVMDVQYATNQIILTVRDMFQEDIFEDQLDKSLKSPWWKSSSNKDKELTVDFVKVSSLLNPIYKIKFKGCYLTAYSSSKYEYGKNANSVHTFTLYISYKHREYEKLTDSVLGEAKKISDLNAINKGMRTQKESLTDKEKEILRNSNKMLEESKKAVRKRVKEGKIDENLAKVSIKQLEQAIGENNATIEEGANMTTAYHFMNS